MATIIPENKSGSAMAPITLDNKAVESTKSMMNSLNALSPVHIEFSGFSAAQNQIADIKASMENRQSPVPSTTALVQQPYPGTAALMDMTAQAMNLQRLFGALFVAYQFSVDSSGLDIVDDKVSGITGKWSNVMEQAAQPAESAVSPSWQQVPEMPVMQSAGIIRYTQEIAAAQNSMSDLGKMQQDITQRAQRSNLFSGSAMEDLSGLQTRLTQVQERMETLKKRKVGSLGTSAANTQMEALRGKIHKAQMSQLELNAAVKQMDVSAANKAYTNMSDTVADLEKGIRETANQRLDAPDRFADFKNGIKGLAPAVQNVAGKILNMQNARQFLAMSDHAMQTSTRLNALTGGPEQTQQLQGSVFAAAQRSHTGYQTMTDSVYQMGAQAGGAFSGSNELISFTELLNKQFTIAGNSPADAQGGMAQLTQAMGSGSIGADTLDALLGQAPNIVQTLADSLGVSVERVRDIAAAGDITAGVFKNAMLSSAQTINEQFAKTPMTFAAAWETVKNVALMALQPVFEKMSAFLSSDTGQEALQGLMNGMSMLGTVAGIVVDGLIMAAQWVVENWGIVGPMFMGLGIAAMAAGLAAATAWLIANWPILVIIGAIGILIMLLRAAGVSFEQVGQVVGAVFGGLYAVIYNCVAYIWNIFASLSEFLSNLFIDPIYAIKKLFYDLALTALEQIGSLADGLQNLVNLIPGVSLDFTSGIDDLISNLKASRDALTSDKDIVTTNRMETKDVTESIMSGRQIGGDITGSISEALSKFSMDSFAENNTQNQLLSSIMGNTAATAGSAGNLANTAEMADEDLKYLRDTAERDAINRFTTAQIRVDMGGVRQNVASYADAEGFIDRMVGGVYEGMEMAAAGVHT